MNKKGNAIISIMIPAIIGVILLSVVFGLVNTQTTISEKLGDPITLATQAATVTEDDGSGYVLTDFYNTTTNYKANIDTLVNISDEGDIITSTAFNDGAYSANYTYLANGYITSSMGRMIVGNVPVIFAVLIFVVVAGGIMYAKGKND